MLPGVCGFNDPSIVALVGYATGRRESDCVLIRMDAAGINGVALPGFEMPTDRNGQLWVYFAPSDKARYVSAVDVLEGRVPEDRIAQRLVLIGTSAAGLLDLGHGSNIGVLALDSGHQQDEAVALAGGLDRCLLAVSLDREGDRHVRQDDDVVHG